VFLTLAVYQEDREGTQKQASRHGRARISGDMFMSPDSVFTMPESVFTFTGFGVQHGRNRCSASVGIRVQLRVE